MRIWNLLGFVVGASALMGCQPGELFNQTSDRQYDVVLKLEADRMECTWPEGVFISQVDLTLVGDRYFGRLPISLGEYRSIGFRSDSRGKIGACIACMRPTGILNPIVLQSAQGGKDIYVFGAELDDCSVGDPSMHGGVTDVDAGVSAVFIKEIVRYFTSPGDAAKAIQIATLHEIGHQFQLIDNHDNSETWDVMYYSLIPLVGKRWRSEDEENLWSNHFWVKTHNPH